MYIENQKNNKKFLLSVVAALVIAGFFTAAYFYNRKAPQITESLPPEKNNPEASTTEPAFGSQNFTGDIVPLPETALPFDGPIAATTTEEISPPAIAEKNKNTGINSSINTPLIKTVPPSNNFVPSYKPDPKGAAARDEQRQSDMRRLAGAQTVWYGDHKRYYTCNVTGGDCRGESRNFPLSIGSGARNVVDPLNYGGACGADYVYCGLDNARESSKFCYYAKLETGGYYVVSENGSCKKTAPPLTLADCSLANKTVTAIAQDSESGKTTIQERDAKRKADMLQLFLAQSSWHKAKGQYYACSNSGGDCRGKTNNYPLEIGSFMAKTPVDPLNTGMICGRDQIYCGLDNVNYPSKYCYYAKLEGGGYYTASQSGNFDRISAPATFVECAQPN